MSEKTTFDEYLVEHNMALQTFAKLCDLDAIAQVIANALSKGKTVYTFGNGGSASEASHFVGELIGRFEMERAPYKAVCLNSDTAIMTAIANDYGYDQVFSRQVIGLVKDDDVVVGFSTSGQSKNVKNALNDALELHAHTIGFTGRHVSNDIFKLCEHNVFVPSARTSIIQEIHQVAMHYIASQVEKELQ